MNHDYIHLASYTYKSKAERQHSYFIHGLVIDYDKNCFHNKLISHPFQFIVNILFLTNRKLLSIAHFLEYFVRDIFIFFWMKCSFVYLSNDTSFVVFICFSGSPPAWECWEVSHTKCAKFTAIPCSKDQTLLSVQWNVT